MPLYSLVNTETANLVGTYPSLAAALYDVASAARRYGEAAPEVVSLSLARDDAPDDEGYVAEGADLIRRALATVPASLSEDGSRRLSTQAVSR
jgi:hypothetical protein